MASVFFSQRINIMDFLFGLNDKHTKEKYSKKLRLVVKLLLSTVAFTITRDKIMRPLYIL